MPATLASLSKELLTIEATGDRQRAEAWFNRYDKMPAELAEAMKAASKLPVDVGRFSPLKLWNRPRLAPRPFHFTDH